MRDSKEMKEIFELSIREIKGVLQGANATDVTRIAASTLGIYSRLKATEIHENALKYQIIKDMGADKEELAKELKVLEG